MRGVPELDPAALTPRGELEPREGVDRDGVGVDAVDVAADVPAAALRQERADAVAQPGQVLPGDRAPDREVHANEDSFRAGNSSARRPMSFAAQPGSKR